MSHSTEKDEVDTLVSVSWLAANLGKENIKVVESSWQAVNSPDWEKMFAEDRIPGSVFFHIDKIADTSVPLPHMLPSKELFEQKVGEMGISNDDHVIIVERTGLYVSSARVWWTFRIFGHNKVSLLDGGVLKWKKEGHPLETTPFQPKQPAKFVTGFRPELLDDFNAMLQHVKNGTQIVDARPPGRYLGKEPEPRPNLRTGHMPGAKSVPHVKILHKVDPSDTFHSFLPQDKLEQEFKNAGINPNDNARVVTTCGSGVTASVLAVGLHLLGNRNYSVYDGSFAEWGQPKLEEVAKLVSGPE